MKFVTYQTWIKRIFICALLLLCLVTKVCSQEKWTASSYSDIFYATIEPRNGQYLIGQYHNWLITIKDGDDKIVTNANISVSGGMVGHGHGMPSQPLVTQYLGEGRYLIEGMLFNMQGQWTIIFSIRTKNKVDKIRFDIELGF